MRRAEIESMIRHMPDVREFVRGVEMELLSPSQPDTVARPYALRSQWPSDTTYTSALRLLGNESYQAAVAFLEEFNRLSPAERKLLERRYRGRVPIEVLAGEWGVAPQKVAKMITALVEHLHTAVTRRVTKALTLAGVETR